MARPIILGVVGDSAPGKTTITKGGYTEEQVLEELDRQPNANKNHSC